VNGFDGISHYLRAGLMANLCSAYATTPAGGCSSKFTSSATQTKVAAKTTGKIPAQLAANPPRPSGGTAGDPFQALHELTDPNIAKQRRQTLTGARGGSTVSPRFGNQTAQDQALDYLLGSGP
jgi:hypothetical protein